MLSLITNMLNKQLKEVCVGVRVRVVICGKPLYVNMCLQGTYMDKPAKVIMVIQYSGKSERVWVEQSVGRMV